MTHDDVLKRLAFSPDADFRRLCRDFQERPFFLISTAIEAAFDTAREKPEQFRNHPPVLALSFGGSTTAVMLAETQDGRPVVHHCTERRNPAEPVPFADYFDDILLGEAPYADYLKNTAQPVISISIAVMVKDGVPYHPSKLKTIDGLVADDPVAQAETHHLGNNLNAWLAGRSLPAANVLYEGDAPVAHLGGVGLSSMGPDDRSILMVCGNGMACADYTRFIVCGMIPYLCDDDPELYPPEMTENGQYQYTVAGKGIYKVLRRAAELAGIDLSVHLRDNHDSIHVFHLWAGKRTAAIEAMETALGADAFQTVQALAAAIVPRGVSCIANSILCSILLNGPAPSGQGYRLFLEGSIGTDPDMIPAIEAELQRLIGSTDLFEELGTEPPALPVVVRNLPAPVAAADLPEGELEKVDMSLIGALFLATASRKGLKP